MLQRLKSATEEEERKFSRSNNSKNIFPFLLNTKDESFAFKLKVYLKTLIYI